MRRAALALLALVAACGPRSTPPPPPHSTFEPSPPVLRQRIVIGAVLPLTGEDAALGDMARRGIEVALERVQAAGGIDELPLVLYIYDSESTELGALRAGLRAVDDDAVVILGELSTERTMAVADAAIASRTPLVTPTAGDRPLTDRRRVHSVAHRYSATIPIVGQYLRQQGWTDIASLGPFKGVLKRLIRTGQINLVGYRSCWSRHYPSVLGSFQAANADAIVAVQCSPAEAAQIGAANASLTTKINVIADSAWDIPSVITDPAQDGTLIVTYFHRDDPIATDFVAAYQAMHDAEPTGVAALSHDAATIVFEAIARAPSLDPDDIDAALEHYPSANLATGSPRSMAIVRISAGTTVFVERRSVK